MGGDGGPAAIVPAALRLRGRADLLLLGDEAALAPHLGDASIPIAHCREQLEPTDTLSILLRRKTDTPLHRGLEALARNEVDAIVSAGDTSALMALARKALAMLPGIDRPAILKRLEGVHGPFYLLDLGANIDCSAELLAQFARMGRTVAERLGGIDAPRVALLNIGTEAGKGPRRLHECAALLEADPTICYAGYVEANRLFDGGSDVVVCDGFAGNVALKAIEGAAAMAAHLLRRQLGSLTEPEREALEHSQFLPALREVLSPEQYNGAILVGLDGVVVKSHGDADAVGFERALEEALTAVESDLPGELSRAFAA